MYFKSSLKRHFLTYLIWQAGKLIYFFYLSLQNFFVFTFDRQSTEVHISLVLLYTLFPPWNPTYPSHINQSCTTFKCSSFSFQQMRYGFLLWALQQSPNSQYYSIQLKSSCFLDNANKLSWVLLSFLEQDLPIKEPAPALLGYCSSSMHSFFFFPHKDKFVVLASDWRLSFAFQ